MKRLVLGGAVLALALVQQAAGEAPNPAFVPSKPSLGFKCTGKADDGRTVDYYFNIYAKAQQLNSETISWVELWRVEGSNFNFRSVELRSARYAILPSPGKSGSIYAIDAEADGVPFAFSLHNMFTIDFAAPRDAYGSPPMQSSGWLTITSANGATRFISECQPNRKEAHP